MVTTTTILLLLKSLLSVNETVELSTPSTSAIAAAKSSLIESKFEDVTPSEKVNSLVTVNPSSVITISNIFQ